MAAAYCPRPNAAAGVSMPLTWEQLKTAYPTDFTIDTVPALLDERGDAWTDILAHKVDLGSVLGA